MSPTVRKTCVFDVDKTHFEIKKNVGCTLIMCGNKQIQFVDVVKADKKIKLIFSLDAFVLTKVSLSMLIF